MKLASVNDLKAYLREEVFSDVIFAEAFKVKIGGDFTEGPLPAAPRVALGTAISPRGGYGLAIRLLDRSPTTIQFARRAAAAAKGEWNAAFVEALWAPRAPPAAGTFRRRRRPLTPGFSAGHRLVTAGTLGTFVVDATYVYALSNNHVFAATNRASAGDPIYQNARHDAGGTSAANVMGGLARYVRLRRTGNAVDAALSHINKDEEIDPKHLGRALPGWRTGPPELGERVWKVGRTTGVTTGTVRAFDVDGVEVDYSVRGDGSRICSFDGQIEIVGSRQTPMFSRGGDSGSVILDARNRPLGLLFAGNPRGVTYANPIADVFAKLRVTGLYR